MRRVLLFSLLIAFAGAAPGCNPTVGENSSQVTITAAFQAAGGDVGAIGIFSDVVSDIGTTADDFFEVNVRSIAKNPRATVSSFYTVEFEGIQLFYTRPDGKNEPGVDVPFPLTYAVGGTVPPAGEAQLNLLVVSREMKIQPPLRNLWFGEGQRIFGTVNVRVFGHDLVKNAVSADASAVVVFGDFPG